MLGLPWVLIATLLVYPSFGIEAGMGRNESGDGNVDKRSNVPTQRPFDGFSIFGELENLSRSPNPDGNQIWWERMARGAVGVERFLILCALKDGSWKKLGDIRDYVEFQQNNTFPAVKLQRMLIIMAGRQYTWSTHRVTRKSKVGEGWLEKNHQAMSWGIESEWRIAPSVLPLLYFLLMGCPEDDRCR